MSSHNNILNYKFEINVNYPDVIRQQSAYVTKLKIENIFFEDIIQNNNNKVYN